MIVKNYSLKFYFRSVRLILEKMVFMKKKLLFVLISIITLILGSYICIFVNYLKINKHKRNFESIYISTKKIPEIISKDEDNVITNETNDNFYLIFSKDYTFLSIMGENIENGKYLISKDKKEISLQFEKKASSNCKINNDELNCNLYANYKKIR